MMRIQRKDLNDAVEQGLLQQEQVAPLFDFLNQQDSHPMLHDEK